MPKEPLAYFITCRTYGSGLHGDDRGSIDREHNIPGTPLVSAHAGRATYEGSMMQQETVRLNEHCRTVVRTTVREVADRRSWTVHALEVRSNHVHLVISAPLAPERVMNDLKSWATRRLIDAGLLKKDMKAWSRHGSTRYLWKERDVEDACRYVCERQGEDI